MLEDTSELEKSFIYKIIMWYASKYVLWISKDEKYFGKLELKKKFEEQLKGSYWCKI